MKKMIPLFVFLLVTSTLCFGADQPLFKYSLTPYYRVKWGQNLELVNHINSLSESAYLSKLIWDFGPTHFIGSELKFSWFDQIILLGHFETAIGTNSLYMWDYDWTIASLDSWTHRTKSSLSLIDAYTFDSQLMYDFFKNRSYRLGPLIGFRYIHWRWRDKVLEIDYPKPPSKLEVGDSGIDYTVDYSIPYLGLAAEFKDYPFALGFEGRFSFWVGAQGLDFHKMRSILYQDIFHGGTYLGASCFNDFYINEQLKFQIKYSFDRINEMTGDSYLYSTNSGYPIGYPSLYKDVAGLSYFESTLFIGISFSS